VRDTVYDTSLIVYSNGDLAGRRRNNVLDRRLSRIEEFLSGSRSAWYNDKLLNEYEAKVHQRRNDVIDAFLTKLADTGKRAERSRLSRVNYAKSRAIRWPSHDQHQLAAALEGKRTTIFVTEEALARCAADVKRVFGVTVLRIA